ncbi:MAG: hypothetical protein INQ03_21255 [Candidatus Heimdallarchaeota archaeon]|nr:hypothetical protein [Candidatus Heimdallarchaeota archaeon]
MQSIRNIRLIIVIVLFAFIFLTEAQIVNKTSFDQEIIFDGPGMKVYNFNISDEFRNEYINKSQRITVSEDFEQVREDYIWLVFTENESLELESLFDAETVDDHHDDSEYQVSYIIDNFIEIDHYISFQQNLLGDEDINAFRFFIFYNRTEDISFHMTITSSQYDVGYNYPGIVSTDSLSNKLLIWIPLGFIITKLVLFKKNYLLKKK